MAVKAFGVSVLPTSYGPSGLLLYLHYCASRIVSNDIRAGHLSLARKNLLQYTVFMILQQRRGSRWFQFRIGSTTITGLGVHQVWTPLVDLPTQHASPNWILDLCGADTWLPYDTYYFPTSLNLLKTPGQIVETNSGTGAVLPTAGFGCAVYRIWNNKLTTPGHARRCVARRLWLHRGKWLAEAHDVPLMQVVIRALRCSGNQRQTLTTTGVVATTSIAIGVP